MIKRLVLVCLGLGCITTYISLQQTQQHSIHYQDILSQINGHPYNSFTNKSSVEGGGDGKEKKNKNYQIERTREELIRRHHEKIFASKTFQRASLTINQSDIRRDMFLLPFLYYNMGPNNLFRIFKESIVIGYSLKRTLVFPPFHHHPRMKGSQEGDLEAQKSNSISVEIFDQSYNSTLERDTGKTFDTRLLNQLIPTIDVEKFQSYCRGRIDILITCGEITKKRMVGIDQFKKIVNVMVSKVYRVDHLRDFSSTTTLNMDTNPDLNNVQENGNFMSVIHKTKALKCVGLALGNQCLGSMTDWFQHWKTFSHFVQRPPEVKILAKQFIESMFHKQRFLAVHWRYEDKDWSDMCKSSRPESVRKINKPICEVAMLLTSNLTMLDSFGRRLLKFAERKNLNYIYLASPPQLQNTFKQLQKVFPQIYTQLDALKFARSKLLMTDVFGNNFATSFLEQELCYHAISKILAISYHLFSLKPATGHGRFYLSTRFIRNILTSSQTEFENPQANVNVSEMFLGSPLSSWTQTVLQDRFVEGRNNYASVLEVVMKESFIFPKLTWYFPEGD